MQRGKTATLTHIVVTSLEALTPEWLTSSLAMRYPGIDVRAAEVVPLEVGPGYHGNLGRIDLLDVSGATPPSTLVAKLVSNSQRAREIGVGMGIYLREALFYEQLASAARLGPPLCHGTVYDLESGLSAILLEDLTSLEVGEQAVGYTAERALATALQLADHHAAFWDAASLADFPWLPIWNQREMVDFVVTGFGPVWQACQTTLRDHLDSDDIALGNRLADNVGNLMEAIAVPPVTLLHGDLRYDNLLFDAVDPTIPPRTVDWQFVGRGRGTQDVAYFLTQSGNADIAATHERDIVTAYHARLVECGVAGYSAEACWHDYRLFALYSLVYPLFTIGMVDPADTNLLNATTAILRRGLDAALRLGSASLIPS